MIEDKQKHISFTGQQGKKEIETKGAAKARQCIDRTMYRQRMMMMTVKVKQLKKDKAEWTCRSGSSDDVLP